MNSLQVKQNMAAGLVILVVFLIVLLGSPTLSYVPLGLASPINVEHKTKFDYKRVQLYDDRPYGSLLVGRVTTELSVKADYSDNKQEAVDYARKLVGQLGGNGLVLHYFSVTRGVIYIEGDAILH